MVSSVEGRRVWERGADANEIQKVATFVLETTIYTGLRSAPFLSFFAHAWRCSR